MTRARRLRANWPALLLPVLAAEMSACVRFHLRFTAAPWLAGLLALAVVAVVAAPAAAARIAPFALFGYGFLGLLVAHAPADVAATAHCLYGRRGRRVGAAHR